MSFADSLPQSLGRCVPQLCSHLQYLALLEDSIDERDPEGKRNAVARKAIQSLNQVALMVHWEFEAQNARLMDAGTQTEAQAVLLLRSYARMNPTYRGKRTALSPDSPAAVRFTSLIVHYAGPAEGWRILDSMRGNLPLTWATSARLLPENHQHARFIPRWYLSAVPQRLLSLKVADQAALESFAMSLRSTAPDLVPQPLAVTGSRVVPQNTRPSFRDRLVAFLARHERES